MEAFAAIEGQESPRVLRRDFQEMKRPQRWGGLRPSFHRMAMGHGVRSSLPTDPGRVRSRRIDRFPTLRQPERGRQPRRPYFSELAVTSLACSSASNFRRTPRMLASLVSASRLLKMAIFSRCMKCTKCSIRTSNPTQRTGELAITHPGSGVSTTLSVALNCWDQ